MNNHEWPHKWFGVWREYGKGYEQYPSVWDFVQPELNAGYEKPRLLKYIRSGYALASSSRRHYPHPVTGMVKTGSICYRTDGVWLWLDDLGDYIEKSGVVIPDAWYRHIQNNQFVIPVLGASIANSLEWPGVKTV
ncbi:hypothetical protein [Paraflavitalea pollutisoli]|uniref:hypothetical protein n=1 Tax=Paraflavitalea pollutisoli TaxID=3034143 RepID=UPI0023EDF3FB|nr:hypothetical protein [Paraflavitalea sp. H1-2-19X]